MNDQAKGCLKQAIYRELDGHTVATLATSGPAGPHAVSLMVAHDTDLALYWVSDPASDHSRQLADSPSCAMTMARQFDDFQAIRGLQMTGHAAMVDGEANRGAALDLLGTRYAFLKLFQSGPAHLTARFAKIAVYRFRPIRIVLIDNAKGFGHKDILELGGD